MSRTAPSETSLTWRGRHRQALGRCWACWWRAGACWGRGRTGRPRPACSCPAAPCAWRRCGRGCRCRARPGPTPARPSGPPASAAAASASPSALQPRQLAETPAPQEDTCKKCRLQIIMLQTFDNSTFLTREAMKCPNSCFLFHVKPLPSGRELLSCSCELQDQFQVFLSQRSLVF